MEKLMESNDFDRLINHYMDLCTNNKTQTIEEVSNELGIEKIKLIKFIKQIGEFGYFFPSFKGLYSAIIRGTKFSDENSITFYDQKVKSNIKLK